MQAWPCAPCGLDVEVHADVRSAKCRNIAQWPRMPNRAGASMRHTPGITADDAGLSLHDMPRLPHSATLDVSREPALGSRLISRTGWRRWRAFLDTLRGPSVVGWSTVPSGKHGKSCCSSDPPMSTGCACSIERSGMSINSMVTGSCGLLRASML